MKKKVVIINLLSIQDSGGITVFRHLLNEIAHNQDYNFTFMLNSNKNILNLSRLYEDVDSFNFIFFKNKGFLYRLYCENIICRQIIKKKKAIFIYHFNGSILFFSKILQLTKIHNLLFYSKNIDKVYFEKRQYLLWFKQIFLKRLVFHFMMKKAKYVEVQSNHVKEYISDFLDISSKVFFIKSDIGINSNLFTPPKEYDFSKKINFLYIVGPHFEYLHKNFEGFVNAMISLQKEKIDFLITVTLTEEQLNKSKFWNKNLNKQTNFLGYVSKNQLEKQFQKNTILISTSIIETLGLHVIESVQQGILVIVPKEKYSLAVYGKDILTYDLFQENRIVDKFKNIRINDNSQIDDIILKNQKYLVDNEKVKFQNIISIIDKILKEKNV